jgi:hypothetical protein
MALYALATVYLYHFLSLGRMRFALVLVAIQGAQIVAFALLHSSASDLVGIQIGTAAVTVVAAEAGNADARPSEAGRKLDEITLYGRQARWSARAASSVASIALLSMPPASLHRSRPSHPGDEQHFAKPS